MTGSVRTGDIWFGSARFALFFSILLFIVSYVDENSMGNIAVSFEHLWISVAPLLTISRHAHNRPVVQLNRLLIGDKSKSDPAKPLRHMADLTQGHGP